jgi:hypothetical protein
MEETKNEAGVTVDVLCNTCTHAERMHDAGGACFAAKNAGSALATPDVGEQRCDCEKFVRSFSYVERPERPALDVTRQGRFVRVRVGARTVALFDALDVMAFAPARLPARLAVAVASTTSTTVHTRGGLVVTVEHYEPEEVYAAIEAARPAKWER